MGGEGGGRRYGWGPHREGDYISIATLSPPELPLWTLSNTKPNHHHQNDSCIKMGSDESHFNVSLTVRDKVTRRCPRTTTFLKRKES